MKKLLLLALGLFMVGSAHAASYVQVAKTDALGGLSLQSTKVGNGGLEPFRLDDQGVQWRPMNEVFVDFMGKSINTTMWYVNAGTSASNTILVSPSGLVSMSTAASTTTASTAVGLQGEKVWRADKGFLAFETRATMNTSASAVVFAGFTDSTSLVVPATISGSTLTSGTANLVGFAYDASATLPTWKAVSVNGGSKTIVDTGYSVVPSSFDKLRVNVDTSGKANFYINGKWYAVITSALTSTTQVSPFVGITSSANAVKNLLVDYIQAVQKR